MGPTGVLKCYRVRDVKEIVCGCGTPYTTATMSDLNNSRADDVAVQQLV